MSCKLCKKSSFRMEFKSIATFRWVLEISSNLFPSKASLNRGNRKKSGGLKSGENDRCSIFSTLFFCQELFDDIGCVRASIVVNEKNHEPLCAYWGPTQHRRFMKRVKISMFLAALILQLTCAQLDEYLP
ncbi:hypothetical protein TNCV_4368271 [Trichonephila clavipes]|nr:hypothetical protein TNCV_4368271 [Trichonephila clavipes]